jgi:hypothetical protein
MMQTMVSLTQWELIMMIQTSKAPINNQLGKDINKTMLAIGTTARRRGVETVIIQGGKNE